MAAVYGPFPSVQLEALVARYLQERSRNIEPARLLVSEFPLAVR